MKTTEAALEADNFLHQALLDPETGFSIGVSGAIAEFMRCDGEAEIRREGAAHVAVTRDGAMRVSLIPETVAVAAETPSKKPGHRQQQVVFCLDQTRARMGARAVLTEIGPDRDAIDVRHREQLIFDLGLDIPHVNACIRTADPGLIELLRRFEGRAILNDARDAIDAIVEQSPQRVFCSRLGRIEVYSPIPERKTPEGPHTHLLPKLLGQPSPVAAFIPEGMVSCLEVYPASPLR